MTWIEKCYAWACRLLYNELAWSYDLVSWVVSLGRWSAWRNYALDYTIGPSVLELGFGTGLLLKEMAQRDLSVTGLDLSPAMHPIAAQRLTDSKAVPSLVRARAQILPFQQGSFDTIVATFPAPYILDPATLSECVRVLRAPVAQGREPGGRLVIVGLWVELENPVLRTLLPLFYGRPDAGWLRSLSAQFEALGMDVTFTGRSDGFARVGIVVAERRREFDHE